MGKVTKYEYNGKTLTLREWSKEEECVVSLVLLQNRVARGMKFAEALCTDKRRTKKAGNAAVA